ncbi:hypothetical protein C2845_PM16G03770 [Panicum miliaceum]|uniref:Uncharacterized protein n=1 Tax=Panicum miliaceum TaxID=4540 RepID=A0A3L6PVM5_PANMI|nr:hypothetical protein C2845_PM16G03770 [Panicum miliaceum]
MPSIHLLNKVSMRNMTLSKVQKKGVAYAKEKEKNDGEMKACSKIWFGHLQVQEKKK